MIADAWEIVYYRQSNGDVPGLAFLDSCPPKVEATMTAVLDAVAVAPPPRFSGGGKWEAMHDEMAGIYEVRVQGPPNRSQYRLFCVLDNGSPDELAARGLARPALAVVTGLVKPWQTIFKPEDYRRVQRLAADYRSQHPRSIGTPP